MNGRASSTRVCYHLNDVRRNEFLVAFMKTPALLLTARHTPAARHGIALETVSRRGEVVRLGPQHVKDGRIHIERTHGSALPTRPREGNAFNHLRKSRIVKLFDWSVPPILPSPIAG